MIGPARTIPSAAADPEDRRDHRDPVGARPRGNSSRMIPKASGKIAPPAPWITRATISADRGRERRQQHAER